MFDTDSIIINARNNANERKKNKDIAIPEINDIPLTIEKTQATLAAG